MMMMMMGMMMMMMGMMMMMMSRASVVGVGKSYVLDGCTPS
jgi:hypothetical protein